MFYSVLKKLPKPVRGALNVSAKPVMDFIQDKNHRKMYNEMVSKGDLCFDIGAKEGWMTKMMLDAGAKQVVLAEPNRLLHAHLRRRFDYHEIMLVPYGISDKEEDLTYNRPKDKNHWGSSSFKDHVKEIYETESETIHCVTLDWVTKKYGKPDFIKVDTEGFEDKVMSTLNHKAKLVLEVHKDRMDVMARALSHLDKLGKYAWKVSLFPFMTPMRNWQGGGSIALMDYLHREMSESCFAADVYIMWLDE